MNCTLRRRAPNPLIPAGISATLALALTTSCAHHAQPVSPTLAAWWRPAGWKTETIPFPLDFAPAIHHIGSEELRFAPGFSTPMAPGYFSYAFVWWLRDREPLPVATLATELNQYYTGLCSAVGKKKFALDPGRYHVALADAPASLAGWTAATGQADLYDVFTTGQPLSLRLRAYQRDCPGDARRAVLVLASAQPESAPIWTELAALAAAFYCP